MDDYGVTDAKIQTLSAQIDALQTAISSMEGATAKKTTATGSVEDLFKQTMSLLKDEMDPLVAVLKPEHPEFCRAYANARKVRNLGTSKRATETIEPATEETPLMEE